MASTDQPGQFPRSISKSAADRLGDRIRKLGLSEGDLRNLQQFRLDYDKPLAEVERVLREELRLDSTPRLKSVNTISEKLIREKTRLSSMQDIGGVRIVREMTVDQQDEIVAQIEARFPGSRVDDRRAEPTHGYRAVHVIATVGGFPVEIQVRTEGQHLWAELFEKLADGWGRQIRYGDAPDSPRQQAPGPTRQEVVNAVKRASEVLAVTESRLPRLEKKLRHEGRADDEAEQLKDFLEKVESQLRLVLRNALKGMTER